MRRLALAVLCVLASAAASPPQDYPSAPLDLHAPIARYLSDFPRPAADRITLHHLLSHTSGLGNHMARAGFERDAPSLTTVESLYRRVREETPQFEPGARFSYSNSGFIVAGRIIEQVTGQPYAKVVTKRVLAPLGMAGTRFYLVDARPPEAARGYVPDGHGGFSREPTVVPQPASDGGVHSTLSNLLAFDRALRGTGLLSEKARRLMQTPNLNGYGYGLSIKPPDEHVSRRTSVGHTGGLPDRSAVLRRFVGDEVTLIVLSNLPQAAITAVKEIERLYFGGPAESATGSGRCPAWSLPAPLSPHDSRTVGLELRITRDDRYALDEPLRNDEAVERVAMVEWQLGHPGRVYPFDGQDDEPGRDLVVEIVMDGLRKREPAETGLDRDFPHARRADQQFRTGRLSGTARPSAEPTIACHEPEKGVGVQQELHRE